LWIHRAILITSPAPALAWLSSDSKLGPSQSLCNTSQWVINCNNLIQHLKDNKILVKVLDDLPSIPEKAYDIISYSNISYSVGPILPVFGIPVH
jgi:hypothetical protein